MTVAELIAALQTLPQDVDVRMQDAETADALVQGLQSETWMDGYKCVVLYPWPSQLP